jgi:GxxExxY protein
VEDWHVRKALTIFRHGLTQIDTDQMLEAPDENPSFPHKETTERIIGAAFEVYNHLGYGYLEKVYQRSMQVELLRQKISAQLERRLNVRYKEVVVGDYDVDLIVEDLVLVELKIAPQYDKRDEAQLLNALKASGLKISLLINFGRSKVEFKRFVL